MSEKQQPWHLCRGSLLFLLLVAAMACLLLLTQPSGLSGLIDQSEHSSGGGQSKQALVWVAAPKDQELNSSNAATNQANFSRPATGDRAKGKGEGTTVLHDKEWRKQGQQKREGESKAGEKKSQGHAAKSSSKGQSWRGKIAGSRLKTAADAKKLREWMECIGREGRWEEDLNPRPLAWSEEGYYFGTCDSRYTRHRKAVMGRDADTVAWTNGSAEKWRVRPSLKYTWQVKEGRCGGQPLLPFNGSHLCQLLGKRKRNVLFSGDSLTGQFEVAFFNHMRMNRWDPENDGRAVRSMSMECKQHQAAAKKLRDWSVCGGGKYCADTGAVFFAEFMRNDFLSLLPSRRWSLQNLSVELPWILTAWNSSLGGSEAREPIPMYDILVINRGAHYVEDDVFARELNESLSYLRSVFPDALVVLRNTPPGHVNCTDYSHPIEKRQDPAVLPFNWGLFKHQNELMKGIAEEYGAVYLDVDAMTALRPDGHFGVSRRSHVDCLHYCLPGPIDVWVQLLYNVLVRLL